MTDRDALDVLHDAFGELERRADAYQPLTRAPARRRRATPLLVAASVAVVVALAVGWAVRLGAGPDRPRVAAGGHPAAGRSAHRAAHPTPVRTQSPVGPEKRVHPAPAATTHPGGAGGISRTFTTVLRQVAGPAATFTAGPESARTFLLGTLTVHGVTGGFDLQYFRAGRGTAASCDDPDRVRCHVTTPPGGGSLATGSEQLQTAPGGVTQQAVYVRPDGVEFLMHVSNAADPKGAGVVGPKPPLTIAQMVAVVSSHAW